MEENTEPNEKSATFKIETATPPLPPGKAVPATLDADSLDASMLRRLLAAIKAVEEAGSTDRMLRQAADELLELVPGAAAAVALLEPGRSWVRLVARGEASAPLEGHRLRQNEVKGLLEVALLDERTITNDDCLADEYAEVYRLARLGKGVATPLRWQGKPVGVIGIFRQVPNGTSFESAECGLLELFADGVGPLLGAAQRLSELDTALKSRDEFLSIASHDLRNPLTALRGFSQLTVRAIDKVPPGQPIPRENLLNNLQRVIKQSNSLDKLIGKLLDVSRINTNRLEIRPTLLDLGELVREAAERCMMAVNTTEAEEDKPAEQRHHLHLEIEPKPLWGQFDQERMEQVVTNLLDNAVKYSPDGGLVEVNLNLLDQNTVELRVRDQGLGIQEEKQMMIFNRWSRIYSPREGEIGEVSGLGLGLFICREIVRKHNGQISLESEPGQGSTFIVTLPLSK